MTCFAGRVRAIGDFELSHKSSDACERLAVKSTRQRLAAGLRSRPSKIEREWARVGLNKPRVAKDSIYGSANAVEARCFIFSRASMLSDNHHQARQLVFSPDSCLLSSCHPRWSSGDIKFCNNIPPICSANLRDRGIGPGPALCGETVPPWSIDRFTVMTLYCADLSAEYNP